MSFREASEADGDEIESLDIARGRTRYLLLRIAVPGWGRHELRFEPAPSGRWAEHWHDGIFHVHCEPARGPHRDHYPSRPIQLFDARAELRRRYALGRDALTCSDLSDRHG